MKTICNWRYAVIYGLLITGFCAIILMASDDDRRLGAFIGARLCLALISAMSFLLMRNLTRRWESRGKISNFTNPK